MRMPVFLSIREKNPEEVKKLAADHKITVLAQKEVEDLQIFHTSDMQAVISALADAEDLTAPDD